ncbi:MAG: hypothetical protein QXP81_09930 [Nitrososphaerota archaeon]
MSYRKGRRLEYAVRDIFRSHGWFVMRGAGSKPIDLVCMKDGRTVLVECKYNTRPTSFEREELRGIARITGARVLIAQKARGQRGLRLVDAVTGEEFVPWI